MRFNVLTLFPSIISAFFDSSIMAKAVERGLVSCNIVDIRSFATDRHKTCDDAPYGGGAGMLMLPEPLGLALESVQASQKRVVYATPSGKPFSQKYAQALAQEDELVFICGRYEGIDQRIIDMYVDDEICIGDYVMSSGELASLTIIDAVYRLKDGVISPQSLVEESFTDGLLEYPQYTRPRLFKGQMVPDVLFSGHHAKIDAWRLYHRLKKTLRNRPDLIEKAKRAGTLSPNMLSMLDTIGEDFS